MRSEVVYYINDEVGSNVRKSLSGNCKMIPLIRHPSERSSASTSFSVLIVTKDIGAGEEFVHQISNQKSELEEIQNILKNNILLGEAGVNGEISDFGAITNRFGEYLIQMAELKIKNDVGQISEQILKSKLEQSKYSENIHFLSDYY